MTEYPAVSREEVRPTVKDVSILERTRTVGTRRNLGGDTVGADVEVFTEETRPNEQEVEELIDMALEAVLGELPAYMATVYYPRIKHCIALYTAILIETSFFRESLDEGSAALYRALLDKQMANLRGDTEATPEESQSLDSVRMRSMAEEDAYEIPTVEVRV